MLLRVPLSVVVIGMEREAQRDFMVEEARDFEVEREEGEELTEVSWMNRRVVGMACVCGGGLGDVVPLPFFPTCRCLRRGSHLLWYVRILGIRQDLVLRKVPLPRGQSVDDRGDPVKV